jgi:hypothetical protein
MYPKNAASPEPIAIGAVVQISDGAVQTSGCTVRIKPIGVAEGDGGGTTAYSTDGIVYYTPTQAETNYTSFILIAKKTGSIPVALTVVTTASSVPGRTMPADGSVTAAVIANNAIDAATFAADVDAEILSYIVDDATRIDATSLNTATVTSIPAILDDTGTAGVVVASASKTGYTLTATTGLGNQTANITGTITTATNVTSVNGIGANVITASALATDAVAEIADGVWDEDATGHQTQGTFGQAIGDPVADTNSIFKATVTDATGATVGVDVAAVLDDTGTAGVVVASGSKTGYTLTATTGLGNQTANITGTITTVTTATNVTTVNGIGANVVTASALATDAVNEIVDQVWDELLSGHAGAGSAGLALSTASSGGVDPSVLADAIWDEALSGHTTAGTAGKAVSDILVDTAEIGTAGAGLTALATQASVNTIDDFLDTEIADIKAKTDNLPTDPADQSAVEAAITAATSPLATAVNLATVAGYLDTEIAAILADTNELQTDWANGGRLDLILDARSSQTSVDDLPTNAELATALGTADDAVLAAIAALNNLSGSAAFTSVLTTQMTESYAADGVAPTLAQAIFLIQQALTEFAITINTGAGTSTTTIKKIDGSTSAATLTLNSETAPTSATRAT